jgi:DNA-binding NtrC family response regulator
MQRAILLGGPMIDAAVLDLNFVQTPQGPTEREEPQLLRQSKTRLIETFERGYLTQLLQQFGGNVSQAASAAGKERRTFQRLLRKRGIQRGDYSS